MLTINKETQNLQETYEELVRLVVANGWEKLYEHKNNLKEIKINNLSPYRANNDSWVSIEEACRFETRSSPSQKIDCCGFGDMIKGNSYWQYELITPKKVKSVRTSMSGRGTGTNWFSEMIGSFRLEGSHDGLSWAVLTTAPHKTTQLNETYYHDLPAVSDEYKFYRVFPLTVAGNSNSPTFVRLESFLLIGEDGNPVNHYGNEIFFRSQYGDINDVFFCALRTEHNAVFDYHNLFLYGFTGYDATTKRLLEHPAPDCIGSNGTIVTRLWDGKSLLVATASPRSLRFICKVNSQFEAGYLGCIVPYGSPNQYAYPMCVGGSGTFSTNRSVLGYRTVDETRSNFYIPGCVGQSSAIPTYGTSHVFSAYGDWLVFGSRSPQAGTIFIQQIRGESYPYRLTAPYNSYGTAYNSTMARHPYSYVYGTAQSNEFLLVPIVLCSLSPDRVVLGEYEGMYAINGAASVAETIVDYRGRKFFISQNINRPNSNEYVAIELGEII